MHTTRRGFIAGAAAVLASPGLVQAANLECGVPHHRYYAMLEYGEAHYFDVVRSDGEFMGMIHHHEIPDYGLNTPARVITHALDDRLPNHVVMFNHHQELGLYEQTVPLGAHLRDLRRANVFG